jgi:hypothetical protein
MHRYLVQRSFPHGLRIPTTSDGADACAVVVANNASEGVTWVHSYVSDDHRKTYCIYDGPSLESVRTAARKSGLTIDHIEPVTVLDPYFYRA